MRKYIYTEGRNILKIHNVIIAKIAIHTNAYCFPYRRDHTVQTVLYLTVSLSDIIKYICLSMSIKYIST